MSDQKQLTQGAGTLIGQDTGEDNLAIKVSAAKWPNDG